jgi:nucleotide-binding universal stress UspA family protein
VVAVEVSYSDQTLEWAAYEAALRQVPLSVVTVYQAVVVAYFGTVMAYPEDRTMLDQLGKAAREQLDKVLDRLGDSPRPQVSVTALSGSPAQEIISAAEGADMVVVGSRGAGGFAQLMMGSVSSQVTHHAHCPVVVIPAAEE